ncbi:anti-sigma factor family protein [Herbidospora mongoliensis]|uniref:anti-sigma factor family protein n=1 Tax=Herbidospora mongoliensis TaxID=688067 RepID=UPI00082BCA18|nr:zf-HC2 domain-containing protein [Herbidospora mongoliensis]
MNHDDVKISLGVYVLGALDARETAMVEAHLDTCDECQAELAELSGLPPMLDRVSAADVEFAATPPRAVLDRLLADSAKRHRRGRITRTMLGLAATVAIVTWGGATLLNSAGPEMTASTAAGAAPEAATAGSSAAQAPTHGFGEADAPAPESAQSDVAGTGPMEIKVDPSEEPAAARTRVPQASKAPEAATSPPADATQPSEPAIAKMVTEEPVTVKGSRGKVTLQLDLTPGEGGTEVLATMTGVPVDTKSELFAISRQGPQTSVASWDVKAGGAYEDGTASFRGSTMLPISEIARFELRAANGTGLITIPVG